MWGSLQPPGTCSQTLPIIHPGSGLPVPTNPGPAQPRLITAWVGREEAALSYFFPVTCVTCVTSVLMPQRDVGLGCGW